MPGTTGARAESPLRRAAWQPGPQTRRLAALRGPDRDRHEGVPFWHRTHARGGTVTTYPDHILRMGSQQLAELKRKAAEFERQLWDAHESLEYEMAQSSFALQDATEFVQLGGTDARQQAFRWVPDGAEPDGAGRVRPTGPLPVRSPSGPELAGTGPAAPVYSPEDRTAELVNHGRHGAQRSHRFRSIALVAIAAAAIAALVTVLVVDASRPKPGWP